MRKINLTTIITGITMVAFLSCNEHENTQKEKKVDNHESQNSLNWEGTYLGDLPCIDCEHIETELVLKKNLTYSLIEKKHKNSQVFLDTLQDNFTWQNNKIKLDGIPDKEKPSMFKIEENQVKYLDINNNEVTGNLADQYILTKIGNDDIENKKWEIIEVMGKSIKSSPQTHYLIFHSKERRLEAKANCNMLLRDYVIRKLSKIKINQGISTLMACPDNLESEFTNALDQADNISIIDKQLTLFNQNKQIVAKFKSVE